MDQTLPVLELRGVRKAYGDFVAVDDFSAALLPGQITGLVGKNGAGKSTVIKMATGAVRPDAGRVLVHGEEVVFRGPHAARRAGIAVVHQELNLVPGLAIAEQVSLGFTPPRVAGLVIDRRVLRERAREHLDRFGLGHVDPRDAVDVLTPVQKRLLMIAASQWEASDLLILDEPTAALTATEVELVHGLIHEVSANGTAVVLVTHRLDEVMTLCDRVVVMRDGALIGDRSAGAFDKAGLVADISGDVRVPETVTDRTPAPRSAPVALSVRELHVANGAGPVSFEVREGEILGLAGLVGAGRTEILRAVYGADRRRGGQVEVAGQPVPVGSPRGALRRGLVLLTEDRRHEGLIPGETSSTNITLASLRRHRRLPAIPLVSRARERRVSAQAFQELGVHAAGTEQDVMLLSGGNQQKVLMARWMQVAAKALMVDEPTIGVDVAAKAEIEAQLVRLAEAGLGVVVVSSEFGQLEDICDRVLVIAEGAAVQELVGPQVTEAAMLEACYGVRVPVT